MDFKQYPPHLFREIKPFLNREGLEGFQLFCFLKRLLLLPTPNPCLARFAINGHGSAFGPMQSGCSLIREGKDNFPKHTYRPNILTSYCLKKKVAFTLAEVLITLGIIGVVAAMTIPVLIAKYQEKQWTTAYLRVYSLLENAYRMAQNENGTFENWAGVTLSISEGDGGTDRTKSDGMAIYNTMIKPYLKLNNTFFQSSWDYAATCMSGSQLYTLANEYMPHDYGFPIVSLASGECISLGDRSADFWVDLNGKKKPNTLGKDIFMISFDIVTRERLKPGYMDRWWTDVPEYCNRETSSGTGWTTGTSCGFWILRHHNMDYLHLPYEEVKKKWNGGWW